jgi:hypothetical protein
MTWVLAGVVGWLVIALVIGFLIGQGIRMADAHKRRAAWRVPDDVPDDLLDAFGAPRHSPGI